MFEKCLRDLRDRSSANEPNESIESTNHHRISIHSDLVRILAILSHNLLWLLFKMKYREHLKENINPKYGEEVYLAYGDLDNIIRQLSSKTQPGGAASIQTDKEKRTVSMGIPRTLSSSGTISDEAFFSRMDAELSKVEQFTLQQVNTLRGDIKTIDKELETADLTNPVANKRIQGMVDTVAEKFLQLEKYVNLNFMGTCICMKTVGSVFPCQHANSFRYSYLHFVLHPFFRFPQK